MAQRIRIAVVGLGFGEHHVRTLANMPDLELVAVADFDEQRRAAAASKYGCLAYEHAEHMMEEVELDALSVCVSPRFRAPLLRAAVDRGLALFVEKPWATNAEHAAELAAICSRSAAPVMTGFSFRFHPAMRRTIELVRGELGAVRAGTGSYVFEWLPPADSWLWDPENGGGIFNENSCHLFDVVCALAGRPVELFAYGIRDSDRPSEKAAIVSLRFESGGTIGLSLGGLGARANTAYPWIELFTEHGWLEAGGENHVWKRVAWARRGEEGSSRYEADPEQLGRTRYTDALEHFVDCVGNGREPLATVADGVLMVRIADAVRESFATGKPVAISGGS
jgi:predicted dehydrogenase